MTTSENSTESKTDSTEQANESKGTGYSEAPKAEETKTEEVDSYGYESQELAKEDAPKTETPPSEEKPSDGKKLTGYGEEEEKKDEELPKKDEEKPSDEKKELEEILKDTDGINKEKVTKFALDNKLSKDQVLAYVKFVKDEESAIVQAEQEALKTQRSQWKQELLKDPEFGGENFDKNVDRVEKVLENFMPNIKKMLTEKGGMLPPYIMRDFLSLAKALNPNTNFVGGEAREVEKNDSNFLDEMYS